ncbi:monovalent cation/H(+) antiporter subunit G [Micromonospora cathayae]|uniref:Monovalent cation/H(+) antiporter subunit G n=1 Tax=Micromonospora cathayae TaxID=3028804 RepID=A0ABY7ZWY1_9ACTN|nr:monovalent cation/H(+) antiporter subunit G [Micromonospora sp. HUAS 3]WDZ87561.1 monovalent cation/H(+) antiporter subunit G [Micromonospora sp. HUAS 3]
MTGGAVVAAGAAGTLAVGGVAAAGAVAVGGLTGTGVADLLAGGCLLAGAVLSLAAGIGVLRLPSTVDRIHAVTKPQVLGMLLILLGLTLRLRNPADLGMLLLVGLFQLATAPVTAQMIGRAAYRSNGVDRELLDTDELA